MIVTFVISQIHPYGYVYNSTAGYVVPFNYRSCHYDCGDLINSVYYKEYLQSDRDSTSALQKVNKIVSSSTDFQQLAGCASAQFSAKWAFEVTWIEAGDYYASQIGSGSGDTGFSMVRTVFILIMISTVNVHSTSRNNCIYYLLKCVSGIVRHFLANKCIMPTPIHNMLENSCWTRPITRDLR